MLTLTFTYGGGRTSNARQSIRLKCGRTTTPGRLTDLKPNLTAIALRCFSTGPDVAHLNFRSVVDVKGTPTNSMRYLTPFSRLVGPIVLTQTRFSPEKCTNIRNSGVKTFSNVTDGGCLSAELDSSPFGLDPAFLPTSALYQGKLSPDAFYQDEERYGLSEDT